MADIKKIAGSDGEREGGEGDAASSARTRLSR